MKKELDYFTIGDSYGGNQEWFSKFMMRLGGCAAETACDFFLFCDLYRETKCCPFDTKSELSKENYIRFSEIMEPYLHPRMSGINKTGIFTEGVENYLRDKTEFSFDIKAFNMADTDYKTAFDTVKAQIDKEFPVCFLNLTNKNKALDEYEWHWFIINGYDDLGYDGHLLVKAVTYSAFEWIDLFSLWNERIQPGGMVIINNPKKNE